MDEMTNEAFKEEIQRILESENSNNDFINLKETNKLKSKEIRSSIQKKNEMFEKQKKERSKIFNSVRQPEAVYCMKCNKMLGKISGLAEIKCTRCKTINAYNN